MGAPDANAFIGPAIDAPPDLPFISFSEQTQGGWTWKLPAVKRYVGERPVAWLDDDPGSDVDEWAAGRGSPTLIARPDPVAGWVSAEYETLLRFAGVPSECEY